MSSLSLVVVRQVDKGTADLGLGERVGLAGMTAAGSAEKRDPKMVAMQTVLDLLNEQFGSDLSPAQRESFVEAVVSRMLENEALVQQARVNSVTQFIESPDFNEAVIDAVADNQVAHGKVADLFYTDSTNRRILVAALAQVFHHLAAA